MYVFSLDDSLRLQYSSTWGNGRKSETTAHCPIQFKTTEKSRHILLKAKVFFIIGCDMWGGPTGSKWKIKLGGGGGGGGMA